MGRIILYTTTGCPYSNRVRRIFDTINVHVLEVNLQKTPLGIDHLTASSNGRKTVPQVFFNTKLIGGLAEVLELVASGQLDKMARAALSEPDPPEISAAVSLNVDSTQPSQKSKRQHVKVNLVLEDIYKRLRAEGGFVKKKKSKKLPLFKGSDLVQWLIENNNSEREDAVILATKLTDAGYICREKEKPDKPFADDNSLWLFSVDKDPHVLNSRFTNPTPVTTQTGETANRSPVDVSTPLLEEITAVIERHTKDTGDRKK